MTFSLSLSLAILLSCLRPIHSTRWAKGIMFLGRPSVCACLCVCVQAGAFLTGLPSTSSCILCCFSVEIYRVVQNGANFNVFELKLWIQQILQYSKHQGLNQYSIIIYLII